jgi:hypothetical protein
MKTLAEREQELQALATDERGKEQVIALWKKYTNADPGHWRPADGWDFPGMIRSILRHEYHRKV